MKKILVVLALLFSSVFANKVNCGEEVAKFITIIGLMDGLHIFKMDATGQGNNIKNKDFEKIFDIPTIKKIFENKIKSARNDGYYTAANFIQIVLNREPNNVKVLYFDGFKASYTGILNDIVNYGIHANQVEDFLLDRLIIFYDETQEILKKLNTCYYN